MNSTTLSNNVLLKYRDDQLENFERLLKKSLKKPTTKHIHDIRVSIRRMAVVINSSELKELAGILGKERDLDVAIFNSASYGLGTKKLIQKRNIARKNSLRAMKHFKLKKLHQKSQTKILSAYKQLMKKLNLKLVKFQKMEMTDKKIHALRITIKEVRYGLEAIGHHYVRLQKMQDLLGHIHDLEVLQKLKGKKIKIQKDKDFATEEFRHSYQAILRFMHKALNKI